MMILLEKGRMGIGSKTSVWKLANFVIIIRYLYESVSRQLKAWIEAHGRSKSRRPNSVISSTGDF